MRFALPALFACFALLTSVSHAQRENQIENTFGIGPTAGWYRSNDADEGALFFGMLGRVRLGNNVGLEASLAYRDAELFHTGQIDVEQLTADVTYVPITFSLNIFLPVGSFLTPYATGGVGFYYTIESYDVARVGQSDIRALLEDEENFETGYHFGLGLEIPFGRNIAVHGEFRYLFLGSEITSIRDVVNLDTDTKNSDGVMLSGGVMVYL
ncbi:MAG: outer membrane beta-barrel protein [Bacteroidota bacterium]|jgi:opacity protein-like surface antigen|nr:outer membrane beta-barrel protein [Bacteroidota bacterium]